MTCPMTQNNHSYENTMDPIHRFIFIQDSLHTILLIKEGSGIDQSNLKNK